jgi:hypothetical protein
LLCWFHILHPAIFMRGPFWTRIFWNDPWSYYTSLWTSVYSEEPSSKFKSLPTLSVHHVSRWCHVLFRRVFPAIFMTNSLGWVRPGITTENHVLSREHDKILMGGRIPVMARGNWGSPGNLPH